MAAITQRGSKWQVRIVNKALQKPIFATLDNEASARAYASHIEGMLDRGIVPLDLLETEEKRKGQKIKKLVSGYRLSAPGPAPSDLEVLDLLEREVGEVHSDEIGVVWVDQWVRDMKLKDHKSPSTIRKRVESLARVLDWHIRQTTHKGDLAPSNPLRLLPKGYSNYTPGEAEELEKLGKKSKKDTKKDLRFAPGDLAKIRAALAGVKAEGKERALELDPDFTLMFELIHATGMRLFEAYRFRKEWYIKQGQILKIQGSKGWRGAEKPRTIPLQPHLWDVMESACHGQTGLLFPFWDGTEEERDRTSNKLSNRFKALFGYAGLDPAFSEHDLRHEATCVWTLLKAKDGHWMFSPAEICKMMGWTKMDMFLRYASLRGEDFSNRFV